MCPRTARSLQALRACHSSPVDDAWCAMHTGVMQRIVERILVGLVIGVGRNQINGAINRRRQHKGSYRRPGLPARRIPWGAILFAWAAISAVLIIINH